VAKKLRIFFFIVGIMTIMGMCLLIEYIVRGPGIILFIAMLCIFLWSVKKYPWDDVLGIFGFLFGILMPVLLGGAYLIARYWSELAACIWIGFGFLILLIFRKRLLQTFSPAGHIAEVFSEVVAWQPSLGREFPMGCLFICGGGFALFIFVMVFHMAGFVMWLVQIFFLWGFRKKHQGKKFAWFQVLGYLIINIAILIILYAALEAIGS